MLIRRAEERDIPRIQALLRQVCLLHHNGRPDLFHKGVEKYSRQQLAQLLSSEERPVFVAVDATDTVAGYVFCLFEPRPDSRALVDVKTLYIDDLCVDEALRGRQIGRQLYEYAVAFARQSGCYNLTLNVWSCNTAAMGFYESCGLKPQKVHLETIL